MQYIMVWLRCNSNSSSELGTQYLHSLSVVIAALVYSYYLYFFHQHNIIMHMGALR